MRCSFVGKGRGRHRVGSSWSSPLPGRRLGHSCCQMSAFWERIRGQGTEFTMMLSSSGWEEVWRLKAPKENLWDARPRKEMRIALGHPRAFNFVIVDSELALFISTPCSWYWHVLFEGYRQTAVYSKLNTRLLKRLSTTYRQEQLGRYWRCLFDHSLQITIRVELAY